MKKGYGLVLNGGGAKGAYEIGAWAALRQLELHDEITAVSGTSVGALNAILIGQGDFDRAVDVWMKIKQEDITPFGKAGSGTESVMELSRRAMEKIDTLGVDPNGFADTVSDMLPVGRDKLIQRFSEIYKLIFNTKGFCSQSGLEKILYENINMERLKIGLPVYACASNMTDKELFSPYYFCLNAQQNKKRVVEIALASSAIFPVYGTRIINNMVFMDGGFADNVPIQPLYDIGCRRFIVIYLTNRRIPDKTRFSDCKFIEVIPDDSLKDDMYSVINFSRDALKSYMEMGYRDTMREFTARGYKRKSNN